jgi:pyruvate/oxaloacetate carboxyltransferase
MPEGQERAKELSGEAQERIYRTLGQGVARAWSNLPQPIQQELFEAAVKAEGEQMRESIAQLLHREHHRTKSGIQARAMPEPDSKGG